MKKILKKEVIIAFIIGIILASSITAYAYNYFANEISYTREGTNVKNVEEALNELYSNAVSRTELFSGSSSAADITLSDSYINYDKLEIYYTTNAHSSYETGKESVIVDANDLATQRKNIVLGGVGFDSGSLYYIVVRYYFANNQNTILKYGDCMRRNMSNGDMYYGNQLTVKKVIGIKVNN